MAGLSRRSLLEGAGALGTLLTLGACTATGPGGPAVETSLTPPVAVPPGVDPSYGRIYAAIDTEPFPVPAIDLTKIKAEFLRKEVAYPTPEPPGTIVVDPRAHYLYLVHADGKATRYGVGVGKEGFGWSGVAVIKFKREWPDWYPPAEMIERRPDIQEQLSDLQSGRGVPGGPRNPIGARGLYLWQGNVDTLYRIHGTIEPYTIGTSVSSGCIRMINQDVMHLYAQVEVGTQVKVLPVKVA